MVSVEDQVVVMRCSCGETFELERCMALKRDRSRCPAYALEGTHYCRTHAPKGAGS